MKRHIYVVLLCALAIPLTTGLSATVLSTDPAPVEPGEYTEVTVRITIGTNDQVLENVVLQPRRTDLIRPTEPPERYDSLRPGDTVTKTFTVYVDDTAPAGDIPFLFTLNTTRTSAEFSEVIRSTDAQDQPDFRIGSTETTPRELLRDTDDNELSVTVLNLGDEPAKQVTSELDVTTPLSESYAYSLEDEASTIPANGEHTFTYSFDIADTAVTTIQSNLDLRYREDNDNTADEVKNERLDLRIPMADAPHLTITSVNASPMQPGTVGNSVTVTVMNNGTADAEDVRTRLFPDISYPFLFDTTTKYVASSLEPGERASAVYEVDVRGDGSTRTYDVTTELEGLVGTNRYEREESITLNVRGEQASDYGWLPYAVVGVILVAAAGIGWYRRDTAH